MKAASELRSPRQVISLRALPATALLAALLALAPACARKGSRGPRSSAASDAVLAAAVIDFHDGHVDTAGDAVGLAIRSAVTARDLQLRELPAQVVTTRFPALPEPDQRLAQLTTFGRDAAFLVLVEARAQYQAPAGARFRWLVHSRTSGDRPDVEGEPLPPLAARSPRCLTRCSWNPEHCATSAPWPAPPHPLPPTPGCSRPPAASRWTAPRCG